MSNPQNWLAFHKCQDFLHSLLCWDYKSKKIMLEVIPVGLWKRRNHTCLNFPVGNSQVDCLASFLIPESGRKFNKNKVYKFTRNTNISPLYNNCRPHFTSATGFPNQFCCHFLFFTGAAPEIVQRYSEVFTYLLLFISWVPKNKCRYCCFMTFIGQSVVGI